MVVVIVADRVCTTSVPLPLTVTVSSTLPTCSVTFIVAGVAVRICTAGKFAVLNPASETSTV